MAKVDLCANFDLLLTYTLVTTTIRFLLEIDTVVRRRKGVVLANDFILRLRDDVGAFLT